MSWRHFTEEGSSWEPWGANNQGSWGANVPAWKGDLNGLPAISSAICTWHCSEPFAFSYKIHSIQHSFSRILTGHKSGNYMPRAVVDPKTVSDTHHLLHPLPLTVLPVAQVSRLLVWPGPKECDPLLGMSLSGQSHSSSSQLKLPWEYLLLSQWVIWPPNYSFLPLIIIKQQPYSPKMIRVNSLAFADSCWHKNATVPSGRHSCMSSGPLPVPLVQVSAPWGPQNLKLLGQKLRLPYRDTENENQWEHSYFYLIVLLPCYYLSKPCNIHYFNVYTRGMVSAPPRQLSCCFHCLFHPSTRWAANGSWVTG